MGYFTLTARTNSYSETEILLTLFTIRLSRPVMTKYYRSVIGEVLQRFVAPRSEQTWR